MKKKKLYEKIDKSIEPCLREIRKKHYIIRRIMKDQKSLQESDQMKVKQTNDLIIRPHY
jgi:hypothetical protein